jgi:hypothetical protein
VPSRPSVARWRCQFWVDCTINISGRKFPTGTGPHADARLRRDARGGNDSFREELAERVKGLAHAKAVSQLDTDCFFARRSACSASRS